ncbi:hypothetical protein EBT23_01270 [bacterium]|nr:hypothetical protein [bacterium]
MPVKIPDPEVPAAWVVADVEFVEDQSPVGLIFHPEGKVAVALLPKVSKFCVTPFEVVTDCCACATPDIASVSASATPRAEDRMLFVDGSWQMEDGNVPISDLPSPIFPTTKLLNNFFMVCFMVVSPGIDATKAGLGWATLGLDHIWLCLMAH